MLKHVNCYQENGNWYMSLKYEFEDENGKHCITIPKMDFPKELTKDPKKSLVFEINEVLNIHQAYIMDPLANEIKFKEGVGHLKSGSELKAIRESLALSVADVAGMTFMTRQNIYRIEKGSASPRNYLFLELFYEDFQCKRLMHQQ